MEGGIPFIETNNLLFAPISTPSPIFCYIKNLIINYSCKENPMSILSKLFKKEVPPPPTAAEKLRKSVADATDVIINESNPGRVAGHAVNLFDSIVNNVAKSYDNTRAHKDSE